MYKEFCKIKAYLKRFGFENISFDENGVITAERKHISSSMVKYLENTKWVYNNGIITIWIMQE